MENGAPLFTGLTRQPELLGVPVLFWVAGATPLAVLFILTQWFSVFLLVIAVYPGLLWLARKDLYFFAILKTALLRTPRGSNAAFWGGNSYGS